MKTPREVLLQQHQTAEARLDAIRCRAVAAVLDGRVTPATFALKLWEELVLPCRGIWAGLSAVWLALLFFHLSGSGAPGPVTIAKSKRPTGGTFLALREQQRILNELFAPASKTEPAASSRRDPPTPHSERRASITVV